MKHQDKLAHLFAGYFVAHICWLLTGDIILSLALATYAGIAKELYDEFKRGAFSVADLIFTIVGGILAMLIK